MEICTKLCDGVLSLEQINTNQAVEIEKLKKRVKKLEDKKKKRTHGLKRMYRVGLSARIVSSDEEGLGDQKDASKQERIVKIDADEDLSLINETVIVNVIAGENVEHDATVAEKKVNTADPVTTAGETLIEIKAAKPMTRGVIVQEPSEFRTTSSSQPSQLPHAKDKGKGIMVEPEKPLKKKDQIAVDEEVAKKLEAQMKDEMEDEEMIAKEKDEANIVVIEE
nr:hypothetical protein [Tanacetum cinerariifolium]